MIMADYAGVPPYQPGRAQTGTYGQAASVGNGQAPSSIPAAAQTEASGGTAQKNRVDGRPNRDSYECQTCKTRKYQDGSNDPGVSFKTPTALSPEKAASAVRSHEQEHVSREQDAARRDGREVVSQSVSYQSAICPECGKVYMAGGTTRTVTKGQVEQAYGLNAEEKGKYLDMTA